MDTPVQRSDSLRSITNFANLVNPRRPLNIFKREGSIASMGSNRNSRQAIEEARIHYLDTRGNILRDFIRQRKDPRKWSEDLHNPVLSANGDIKSDFALMERLHDEEEKEELKYILLILYGTASLEMGSGTSRHHNPLEGISKPWGKLSRHTTSWRQNLVQLRAESARTLRQSRQPAPYFPTNIIQSEDMLVILNARATVLLNISFRNLSQPKQIVKLSNLALTLWLSRVTETDWGYSMFDKGSEDEENAWILQRLILLIRDDVYQHLCSAIDDFAEPERGEQQRHIGVFVESMRTWQKITNRHFNSMRGYEHDVESKSGYAGYMSYLRDSCEKNSERDWGTNSLQLCHSWPYSWNRTHDHGAEWVAPLSSDENDKTPPVPISVPWLERRECGYWFQLVDEIPVPRGVESDYERVSAYLGRTIEESKRKKCRYRC